MTTGLSDEELEETAEPADHAPAEPGRPGWLRVGFVTVSFLAAGLALALGLVWLRGLTPPSQTSPEVGFARDMYTHHDQAVTMSLLVRNQVPEPVNTLSHEIITGQSQEQGMFTSWLDQHKVPAPNSSWHSMQWMSGQPGMAEGEHGHGMDMGTATESPAAEGDMAMPGLATDAELTRLAQVDGRAKQDLYLQLMRKHHVAGVQMAEAYLRLGSDDRLRQIAEGMVTAQERELKIIDDLLATPAS